MAAAEAASMAEEEVVWERSCTFRNCVCCWFYPGIPRVAPGLDHFRVPPEDDADHRPAWSLLVGVLDGASSSIRTSRLRVARSGRILGRSDDKLEVFHDILLAKPPGYSFGAAAALAPDGRSLCVLRTDDGEQPQAMQLSLQPGTEELRLPEIEMTSHCMPISAAGQIWALSLTLPEATDPSDEFDLSDDIDCFSVVMRRLVPESGGRRRWEQVGDHCAIPFVHFHCPRWSGGFLQGYAVLPGTNLILVSFQQYGLFFTFSTDSGCWTRVHTDEARSEDYLPIHGRGIYMEQHVYMLCENTIYAYKLTDLKDDEGMSQLSLDPPIEIDSVCPFMLDKGYGFLTCLTDRLVCSVWISLAWRKPCPCDDLHAIVTTFHLLHPAKGGIKVLHSTYRRVQIEPYPPRQEFCFLQEYEEEGSPALQQPEEEQEDSSHHVNQPSKMPGCCSFMEISCSLSPSWFRCFECGGEGHVASQCTEEQERTISTIPPFGPSRCLLVDPSSRQHDVPSSSPVITVNPAMKKDVFIICQAGSRPVILQTGVMDTDAEPLQPCYVADDSDHSWHFFQSGSKINAVSSIKDGMLEFSLNKDQTILRLPVRRPAADPFIMVIKVGGVTIALTDTLQVFHQEQLNFGPSTWLRYLTNGSEGRKVLLSGYAVVNDDSFIIYDAVTCSFLLFNLGSKQWRDVTPCAVFGDDMPRTICTNGLLNGRCVVVDGFIYTCINGGIAAYELVGEYIGKPIFLTFSWDTDCVGEHMCLDYAGKDEESGTIWFYVVQGGYSLPRPGVHITTVKVKTKRSASDKMIPAEIDRVVTVMDFIDHDEPFFPKCCFAVSCA